MAHPGGRPRKKFNLKEVELHGELGSSFEDMASLLECSISTISLYMNDHDSEFSKSYQKGAARTHKGLRRKTLELAKAGNVPMLIWACKNWLGFADHPTNVVNVQQTHGIDPLSPAGRQHFIDLAKSLRRQAEDELDAERSQSVAQRRQ